MVAHSFLVAKEQVQTLLFLEKFKNLRTITS
jgi:hypothetical protein